MRFATLPPATLLVAFALSSPLAIAQGRVIAAFPHTQSFAFVPSGTTTTPSGPIGTPVFPTADADGGEMTVDANTSATLVNATTTGLNNNGGAGGALRIQTSGTAAPTNAQGFVLHASFTGYLAGSISIDWSKATNGTSTRANELRIAVSVDGGVFTDLATATFDNSAAAQTGTLSTLLPASLDGAASVRFRVYSINVSGTGSHPRVVVDNLQIGASEDLPLPVELAAFTVSAADGTIALDWRTSSEQNNEGFEILRSIDDDSTYVAIASYRTHAELRGLGTSAIGRDYHFEEAVPPSLSDRGGVVRYRLVDVAPDGTRAEQGTRAIRIVAMREEAVDPSVVRLRLDPPVPTPAVDHVHVRWTQAVRGATTLELIGPHGVLHRRIDAGVIDAGEHGLDVPLDDLASGRYLLVVSTAGAVRSQPCVVVR